MIFGVLFQVHMAIVYSCSLLKLADFIDDLMYIKDAI